VASCGPVAEYLRIVKQGLVTVKGHCCRQVACPAETLMYISLEVVSAVNWSCPSWIPRWMQKEWLRVKTDTQWTQRCQAFLLLFADLWVQPRAAFECLLQKEWMAI
jgi:hypothetical protein